MRPETRRGQLGFTLIELILALTIVATLLAVTFAGLRVGLGAWRRGEARAEAQQHVRSLFSVLARTVGGAYPYQAAPGPDNTQPVILFQGESDRVALVTTVPPFPLPVPAAFAAVTLAMEDAEPPGLAVRQKLLPNDDPFEALRPLLLDVAVTAARFRYLRAGGAWEERWDAVAEQALPRAVEISLTTRLDGRTIDHPPVTIAIPVGGAP
jgi:general secretion pathway protein J